MIAWFSRILEGVDAENTTICSRESSRTCKLCLPVRRSKSRYRSWMGSLWRIYDLLSIAPRLHEAWALRLCRTKTTSISGRPSARSNDAFAVHRRRMWCGVQPLCSYFERGLQGSPYIPHEIVRTRIRQLIGNFVSSWHTKVGAADTTKIRINY